MLKISEIAKAIEGEFSFEGEINNISIDTRTLEKGDLYFAIKGDAFDGHDFINQSVKLGAKGIVSEKDVIYPIPVITVKDTRAALLKLGGYYREKLGLKLVAVTGSVGKTSTKDMIYSVLNHQFKTLKTLGNLNNEIGLPLTLLRLTPQHKGAVVELGMSDLGEISELSKCCKPNIGVITNIGYSHIETLKTRENILKAKLEIVDGMADGGVLFLNGDDEYLRNISSDLKGNKDIEIKYFSLNSTAYVYGENIKSDGINESFTINYNGEKYSAKIPVRGNHNVSNALAAFCVGLEYGISPEDILLGLMEYESSDMRQKIVEKQDKTLIIDCYNASPTSMSASISVLSQFKGRKIAVLGDMLELGEKSKSLHEGVAVDLEKGEIDLALFLGENMLYCHEVFKGESHHFYDKNQLSEFLISTVKKDDIILFKGSRGMKLEEVANSL